MSNVPVLTCTELCKSYRVGQLVLDHFQCSLPSGKIIGLLDRTDAENRR